MTETDNILIRWCTIDAATKGVVRVRVIDQRGRGFWGDWQDPDRWRSYKDDTIFENKDDAIADGERRRQKRRELLQRQLEKLAKPMRVVDKVSDE